MCAYTGSWTTRPALCCVVDNDCAHASDRHCWLAESVHDADTPFLMQGGARLVRFTQGRGSLVLSRLLAPTTEVYIDRGVEHYGTVLNEKRLAPAKLLLGMIPLLVAGLPARVMPAVSQPPHTEPSVFPQQPQPACFFRHARRCYLKTVACLFAYTVRHSFLSRRV